MSKKERETILEFVNTQIGHLTASIRLVRERSAEDQIDGLKQLLDSLKGLKSGVETGKYPWIII